MTREEIDKVIKEANDYAKLMHDDEREYMTNLISAVKQLREENADLTNRLTNAQDFINDQIEKGRR